MTQRPVSLKAMLRWFLARYNGEQETAMHRRGVWVGRQQYDQRKVAGKTVVEPRWASELVGGSLLGSPAEGPATMARSPWGTHHESYSGLDSVGETYTTPMHATLAWMATRHPLKAQWLHQLGRSGGDWMGVTAAAQLPDEYGEAITRDALGFCLRHFEEAPLTRAA